MEDFFLPMNNAIVVTCCNMLSKNAEKHCFDYIFWYHHCSYHSHLQQSLETKCNPTRTPLDSARGRLVAESIRGLQQSTKWDGC